MTILNNPIKDHKGSQGCVPRALRSHLKGFCATAANIFLTVGELQELALWWTPASDVSCSEFSIKMENVGFTKKKKSAFW